MIIFNFFERSAAGGSGLLVFSRGGWKKIGFIFLFGGG
jgi:hypothetical protein